MQLTLRFPIDFPPSLVSVDISRHIPVPTPKIKDPIDVAVERFCRLMALDKRNPKNTPIEDLLGEDLGRTNVEKVLKTSGVTKNLELQKTVPNPSEKTRTKLRKVRTFHDRFSK